MEIPCTVWVNPTYLYVRVLVCVRLVSTSTFVYWHGVHTLASLMEHLFTQQSPCFLNFMPSAHTSTHATPIITHIPAVCVLKARICACIHNKTYAYSCSQIHAYTHTCTHTYTHTHTHAHTHTRTHTHAYTRTPTHLHTHMQTLRCVSTLTHTHTHAHLHTRTHTHANTQLREHTRTHTHTNTHTHAHTHTRTHTHANTHMHEHTHPADCCQGQYGRGPPAVPTDTQAPGRCFVCRCFWLVLLGCT